MLFHPLNFNENHVQSKILLYPTQASQSVAVLAKKIWEGRAPERQGYIVSSVAIISSRWKNWVGGA